MSDRYQSFVGSRPGRVLARRLGLPQPAALRRYERGQPLLAGPALVGGRGRLREQVGGLVDEAAEDAASFGALVYDASEGDLREVYEFFHPVVRRLAPSGRLVVLADAGPVLVTRALAGFVRSGRKGPPS